MRRGASLSAFLAALLLAGCSTPAPPPTPTSTKESERAPVALPDAYKHPPK